MGKKEYYGKLINHLLSREVSIERLITNEDGSLTVVYSDKSTPDIRAVVTIPENYINKDIE